MLSALNLRSANHFLSVLGNLVLTIGYIGSSFQPDLFWSFSFTHIAGSDGMDLATLGLNGDFFSKVIESGTHLRSLEMILNGEIDASAIDSIVLEVEIRHSDIGSFLRKIGTIGPSPIPPLVISNQIPVEDRKYMRDLVVKMDEDPRGHALLEQGDMIRLADVKDRDYDVIRGMYRKGKDIYL